MRTDPAGCKVIKVIAVCLSFAVCAGANANERIPKFDVFGRLEVDAFNADGVYGEGTDNSLRRARLGGGVEFTSNLSAELTLDFDQETKDVSINDLSVKFDLPLKNDVYIGLIKVPYGLEKNSSSRTLRTVERSLATDAISPDRRVGLLLRQNKSQWFRSAGIFFDENREKVSMFSGRVVWAPVDTKLNVLHFGGSVYHEILNDERFRLRTDGALQSASNFVRSDSFDAEQVTALAAEFAWMRNSLSAQSEVMVQQLGGVDGGDKPLFFGVYGQVGWVFNGRRKYSAGRFRSAVGNDQDSSTEATISYSYLDAEHEGEGDIGEELVIGLNRQVTEHLRLSAHVFGTRVSTGGPELETGRGGLVRLQLSY